MAKVRQVQTSFVSGELDPTLFGRVDTEIYKKAAKRLRNGYVRPQGGFFRREGLEYIDTTTSSAAGRLVPFEFNAEQTYILVFTPGQFKVYRTDADGVQATVSSSPVSGLTADIIAGMNWTQSADTLIIVHPDIQPIRITRTSHTSWTAASLSFSNIPTYDYGSGAEAVISGTRGWVRSIAFYKGRLWLCGLGSRPQTILASKVGDFFNLNVGTSLDDEAIDFTIDDDRVNKIVGVFPGRGLQIFTTGGEFTLRSSFDDPITPTSIPNQLAKETLHGSAAVRPQSVDGATVFIEAGGSVVRQFIYSDTEQSFNAPNISILSQHLLNNPVAMDIRRAVDTHPTDYLYVVNGDGTCAVLNSLREQDLLAWSLFETEGEFEDVGVSGRLVYFIVKREVNGSDVRFIERLNADHFTDASVLQTNGSPTDSWSNLAHLNGETVKVRGDDFIFDDALVGSGSITSSDTAVELEAGIDFSCLITSLPLDVIIEGQSFAGQYKAPQFANIQLYETRNIIVTHDGRTSRPAFRSFGLNVLDQAIDLFTGWKKVYLGGIRRDIEVSVTQQEPLEMNILSIVYTLRV